MNHSPFSLELVQLIKSTLGDINVPELCQLVDKPKEGKCEERYRIDDEPRRGIQDPLKLLVFFICSGSRHQNKVRVGHDLKPDLIQIPAEEIREHLQGHSVFLVRL